MSDDGNKPCEAGKKKAHALPDSAREAMLEQAASALAAIHMAKQVGAQVLPTRDGSGTVNPLTPNLRLPMGDILFGVAQLQIDFARRLFEFNKNASSVLRERLRKNPSRPLGKQAIVLAGQVRCPLHGCFKIKNGTSLSKTFNFRPDVGDVEVKLEPPSITIPAGESREIKVIFCALRSDTYSGDIAVESQGLCVEHIPCDITVT